MFKTNDTFETKLLLFIIGLVCLFLALIGLYVMTFMFRIGLAIVSFSLLLSSILIKLVRCCC